MRHLKPDFRSIAAFRRVNRSAFRKVFREFVILCRQLDLFGRELLAVDGTRIKAVNQGYFAKELFRYDPGDDVYVCPGGATLYPRYEGKVRDNRKVEYCNRAACRECALKPRCTGNLYRRVSRLENEAVLDARPDILDRRR